jgi:pyrimidine operon attenuation protein/uracil phosphoribosyltransferase
MTTNGAPGLSQSAEALYLQLREHLGPWRTFNTQFVGIASGGAWIARRLMQDWGLPAVGVISSTMHRDDYLRRGAQTNALKSPSPRLETTDLPFDVTGAHIVLVDDVLYTGRTIRAVINELFDYGRPASVRLAVLVDRQGRQLPLAADYAALRTELSTERSLQLGQGDDGQFTFEIT